jgi:uncharacterized RDD family membrane protein YckC
MSKSAANRVFEGWWSKIKARCCAFDRLRAGAPPLNIAIFLVLVFAWGAGCRGAEQHRDLMAVANGEHFWIARVSRDPVDNSTFTSIVYREHWSRDWTALPTIPDRVVGMATSNGELLLVLANGQWEIADDEDIRSGPTGALWDTMIAIAGGPDAVWAIVRSSAASTQEIGEEDATNPSTPAAEEPATLPDGQTRLVVCQFIDGKWTNAHLLPEGVSDYPAQMSMTVVNGLPVLAWRTADGMVSMSAMSAEGAWTPPIIATGSVEAADFKLLTINERSVLWLAAEPPSTRPSKAGALQGAGEILIGPDFARRIALEMPGRFPTNVGSQTLVPAFGNLRWIAYAGDQQFEQDYGLDAFPRSIPAAKPMSVVPTPKPPVIPLMPWVIGDGALVALAAVAAVRQRSLPKAEMSADQRDVKPRLAPLGIRFVAGLVDLAPVLAVVAILHPANPGNPLANLDEKSFSELAQLSLAAYVLHTLIAELICGQSIGKMVFGLRVMGTDGNPPRVWAVILRNLLRVFDVALGLPLLIVFITPLQQRVGDVVAGTVVVGGEGDGDEEEDER